MADDPADDATDIEMVVESVRVHMLSSRHVVILKETGRERYLPIWIGPWEASAIAMRLQGLTPERPLTHDLFATVLGELGVRVDRILISSLADETFHARLVLVSADARHEIDARPSDAIALAVRLGVPIYATEAVLDQAALGTDGSEEDEEAEEGSGSKLSAAALEATGEKLDPTKLNIFREFVNSLDLEGGEPRGGSDSQS
jgi:hypothetical protein